MLSQLTGLEKWEALRTAHASPQRWGSD